LLSFWSQSEKRSELMARSLLASPSATRPVPRRLAPRRLAAGLAGAALVVVLAGCATPYTSGQGTSKVGASGATEIVVVCDSGIVTHPDGTQTSSSVARRLPAGSPVPAGCRLG
jgi:ferric-dicitrate binding protein FerR (iron transport regulator)